MPSINLIASRREQKRRLEQHVRRLVYSIVAEFCVILLITSVMVVKLTGERGQIDRLDGQIGLLRGKVNEIQLLQAQTAALKPKVALLDGARNNTLYWYTALQTVVASLPNQAWLTSMATAGDPAPPPPATKSGKSSSPPPAPTSNATLTFTGMAADSDQVGLAMMKMNQFANISQVNLSSVQQSTYGAMKTMTFSMVVQLKPDTAQNAATPEPSQPDQSLPGSASPTAPTGPASPTQLRQAVAPTALPTGAAASTGEKHA